MEGEVVQEKVDWKGRKAVREKHGGPRATLFLLGTFACENIASFSMAVNMVTYFHGVMHYDLADAATHLTNFLGTSYLLSILVAFLADTYIGRFKALLISACIEFLGLLLLAVQAYLPKLKPPLCNIFDPTAQCVQVSGGNAALLFVALYLVAIGTAGVKAALPAHGADQFDEKNPKEATQLSSFFNWLLLSLCVGGAIGITLIVWVDDNKGWGFGFSLCAGAMFLGILSCIVGLPCYRIHVIQESSVLLKVIQVYVAAFRNRELQLPENPEELHELDKNKELAASKVEFLPHRDVYRFLDKAAVITSPKQGERPNPWKLCRVTQVENAKVLLGMVPIFCCTIIMTLCLAQLQTFSIQQGLTMDRRFNTSFSMPPASLPILALVFLIIVIPVYDRIIVPFVRKFTSHITGITHLQRIGVGLILSALSMAAAAIMEGKRKHIARDNHMVNANMVLHPLPINVFWISFQYFTFGIADMFTYIGLLEFFYSQAPNDLKSISTCFLWSSMALGYYLSTVLVKVVNASTKDITSSGGWLAGNNINTNHLDLFYWLLSIFSFINFVVYLFVSNRYKYRPQTPEVTKIGGSKVYEVRDVEL